MRILVLASDAFGGHGGIAKFNRDLLTALCAHSARPEVVAVPRRMPNPTEPLPARLDYVTSGLNGKLSYAVTTLKVVLRKPKFDLIICGHINLLPLAFLLRLRVRAPIILVIHGVDAWEPTGRLVTDRLVRKVDAFISVSELTKQRFLKWTRLDYDEGFVLPNAVDLDRYGPGPRDTALLTRYGLVGKTVLMTLGRLASAERRKGFDEVVEVLPALSRKIPDLAYLVAGDGPDRRRLEEKVKSLSVDEHVVFAGFIPEAEKADHYRLADAYVMPSEGEGFGIVHLEAMACGVPVVASKIDGSREAVRNGKLGILVDPDDLEEVEAGILEALNCPKGIVPEELDYFSYDNFQRRCHHVIEQVLEDGRKRERVRT